MGPAVPLCDAPDTHAPELYKASVAAAGGTGGEPGGGTALIRGCGTRDCQAGDGQMKVRPEDRHGAQHARLSPVSSGQGNGPGLVAVTRSPAAMSLFEPPCRPVVNTQTPSEQGERGGAA